MAVTLNTNWELKILPGLFQFMEYGIEHAVHACICIILISFLCSGLWSLLAVAVFVQSNESLCYLHATFEGLCFCKLRLPHLVIAHYMEYPICIILSDNYNRVGLKGLVLK